MASINLALYSTGGITVGTAPPDLISLYKLSSFSVRWYGLIKSIIPILNRDFFWSIISNSE